MKKIFKLALVLWIAAGISLTGYLHINPDWNVEYEDDFTKRDTSALASIVGIVLIAGIGWVVGNSKN